MDTTCVEEGSEITGYNNMKKSISIFIIFALLLVLGSCKNGQKQIEYADYGYTNGKIYTANENQAVLPVPSVLRKEYATMLRGRRDEINLAEVSRRC